MTSLQRGFQKDGVRASLCRNCGIKWSNYRTIHILIAVQYEAVSVVSPLKFTGGVTYWKTVNCEVHVTLERCQYGDHGNPPHYVSNKMENRWENEGP